MLVEREVTGTRNREGGKIWNDRLEIEKKRIKLRNETRRGCLSDCKQQSQKGNGKAVGENRAVTIQAVM